MKMVDKEMALIFSVRNNRGVYALLLGSGVSKAAEIPTGWGVVEDLIEKVAEIEGAEPEDPFEWDVLNSLTSITYASEKPSSSTSAIIGWTWSTCSTIAGSASACYSASVFLAPDFTSTG